MEIYVVQPNDTIYTIANKFNVSARTLIRNNELKSPFNLVTGQTIVIVYPKETYKVKKGDSLESIANSNNVSQMQLLRNNPFLSNNPVTPGEVITISYNTMGKFATNGYAYPFIQSDILKKTLPSLTYITIYNYRATQLGELRYYYDDSNIIQTAKDYGTIPLMMLTSFTLQGEPHPEVAENILSNYEYQEKFINNVINIIISKGYLGINFYFDYLILSNIDQHLNFVKNIEKNLQSKGLLLFVTINPNVGNDNAVNQITFEEIDYSFLSDYVNNITFLQFTWGVNYGPPAPTNSIDKIKTFTDYIIRDIPPDKISTGYSLISYNWSLPYIPGKSYANALSINGSIDLAINTDSTILFDEVSQAPFFTYIYTDLEHHIVWSIDARSISALVDLIIDSKLNGASFWNLMYYYAQMWLVINSQYEIEKLIPNKFDQ